jgi:hypothetical protein
MRNWIVKALRSFFSEQYFERRERKRGMSAFSFLVIRSDSPNHPEVEVKRYWESFPG